MAGALFADWGVAAGGGVVTAVAGTAGAGTEVAKGSAVTAGAGVFGLGC